MNAGCSISRPSLRFRLQMSAKSISTGSEPHDSAFRAPDRPQSLTPKPKNIPPALVVSVMNPLLDVCPITTGWPLAQLDLARPWLGFRQQDLAPRILVGGLLGMGLWIGSIAVAHADTEVWGGTGQVLSGQGQGATVQLVVEMNDGRIRTQSGPSLDAPFGGGYQSIHNSEGMWQIQQQGEQLSVTLHRGDQIIRYQLSPQQREVRPAAPVMLFGPANLAPEPSTPVLAPLTIFEPPPPTELMASPSPALDTDLSTSDPSPVIEVESLNRGSSIQILPLPLQP